eukprot:CAMPEP_0185026182 /NCGR_PEP_ID=MMETSP1103-20130426/10140_1 /TAXON_ID=36769 /ORGANISM="Paraphysomonas bandaiensis, Strain Caron Lab Isolate" /LENGTH=750 /DNA_ID=CAMNT_0027559677 /DNA_START=278 /DNA_END=2529 /DNA_ORIENTATION=+
MESPQNEVKKRVGNYLLGNTVGEGTFGKVKSAIHIPTGEKVAVKILEKKRIQDQADVRRVNREIKILKKAKHSNIIQLFEVLDTPNSIYLIMENADGGEMFDYIVANRHVPERQACKFFHQILNGVEELHKNEITHRDLKPENLLLKNSPAGLLVKIVDFGLSNTHDGGRLLSTACGSPCYAAPEMIAGKQYKGPVADIWSLGVILFALVCGHLPFEDPNTSNLYRKILSGEYKTPKWISAEVKDLIRKILETNPEKRLTIHDIRSHPWLCMVPQTQVPRDDVATAEEVEETRNEVLKRIQELGMDAQAVLDAVSSRACNSLSAMFYLLTQKEQTKARLSKKHSHASRPETSGQSDRGAKENNISRGSPAADFLPSTVTPSTDAGSARPVMIAPKVTHTLPSEPVVLKKVPGAGRVHVPKLNVKKAVDTQGLVIEGQLTSQSARPEHSPAKQQVAAGPQTARPVLESESPLQPKTDSSPTNRRPAPRKGITAAAHADTTAPADSASNSESLNVVANAIGGLPAVDIERPSTRRSKSRGGAWGSDNPTERGGKAANSNETDGPGMGKIPSREELASVPQKASNTGRGAASDHVPQALAPPKASKSSSGAATDPVPQAPRGPQRSGGSAAGRRGRHLSSNNTSQSQQTPHVGPVSGTNITHASGVPPSRPTVGADPGGVYHHRQGLGGRNIQPLPIRDSYSVNTDTQSSVNHTASKPNPTAREIAQKNKASQQQGNISLGLNNGPPRKGVVV